MSENTVTLVGNVVVTRGSNVLRGQRLVVDLTSGVSKMDGGRIDGIFQSGRRNPPDPRNEKSGAAEKRVRGCNAVLGSTTASHLLSFAYLPQPMLANAAVAARAPRAATPQP